MNFEHPTRADLLQVIHDNWQDRPSVGISHDVMEDIGEVTEENEKEVVDKALAASRRVVADEVVSAPVIEATSVAPNATEEPPK